jgi:transcriptional regulator with XRE-family HTH domain
MNDKSGGLATPLGHQIRRLREARGWTLAALARRARTSAPALHRYENGWDRFRIDTLRKVAGALGARLDSELGLSCQA